MTASAADRLLDTWRLLARRRWIILATLAAVLVGVGLRTMRAVPTYRAAATVQIERVDPNILKFQDLVTIDPSAVSYQDFYQTQYRLLQSRAVARLAVDRLGLARDPDFLPAGRPGLPARIWNALARSARSGSTAPEPPPSDPETRCVDAVLAGLHVEPIKNSHLVSVAYVSRSPQRAADVANGVAEAYISFGMETKLDTSEHAQDFLVQQIASLRKEVEDLERQAQQYGESKEIIPTSGEGNTTLAALEDLQRAYTAAQASRAEKEAAYTAVRTAPDGALPQVLASPLIQELTSQAAALEREQAELSRKFKPGWPELARISSKLEQARTRLAEETAALAASAREEAETAWRAALEHERNLSGLYEKQKQAALRLSTDSIEYTNLRSEVAKKRETLDQILKRQSEVSLSTHLRDSRQSNIRIVDPARVPKSVYKPNVALNLLVGLLAGLGLGLGLAFAIDTFDSSIKSPDEVLRLTGFAPIGLIPELRPYGPRPLRREKASPRTDSLADLITHSEPRSEVAEAYKELRTATLLATPDQPPRTILVTSSLSQEGKSQTSLNLAIALAQAGKQVLLVDADLRRPRLHRALALDNDKGLSTYLSGNAALDRLILETDVPGLRALTSGPIPPNPSELLASRNFLTLVRQFADAGEFDHLIFDSPPLLSVADPIVIATVLDGTLLVAQCGQTPREALVRATAKLRQSNVKILGVVLNGAAVGDRSYYYRSGLPEEDLREVEKRESRPA